MFLLTGDSPSTVSGIVGIRFMKRMPTIPLTDEKVRVPSYGVTVRYSYKHHRQSSLAPTFPVTNEVFIGFPGQAFPRPETPLEGRSDRQATV